MLAAPDAAPLKVGIMPRYATEKLAPTGTAPHATGIFDPGIAPANTGYTSGFI